MSELTIHTSDLFDPKQKKFLKNFSVAVSPESGLITKLVCRDDTLDPLGKEVPAGDIDLRGSYVMPGFVDAHTHIFLHSYEYVFELLWT